MGKQGWFSFVSMFVLSTLMSACMPTSLQTPQTEPCIPTDSIINPYQTEPAPWLWEIYSRPARLDLPPGSQPLLEAKYAAYTTLGRQTKRWSSFVDIDLPNSEKVRITVTYLSPQLLGIIHVNQMLLSGATTYNQDDFENRIKAGMATIAKRNESLFLLTISSSKVTEDNVITFNFPVSEMELTNSSKKMVYPSRYDHSLDHYIRLVDEAFPGFVAYQLTVKDEGGCKLLLDPLWDTTISIHINELTLNGSSREQQTWTIRYAPPVDDGYPDEIPNFFLPTQWPDFNLYIPAGTVPDLAPVTDEYWQQMGCYIWEQVTFANSP